MNGKTEGVLDPRVAEFLLANGLVRIDELHWARVYGAVIQHVFFSLTRGEDHRVEVFVQSLDNLQLSIGGTMTSSSILAGGAIGGESGWIHFGGTEAIVDSLLRAIESICMPVFDSISTQKMLEQVASRNLGAPHLIEVSEREILRLRQMSNVPRSDESRREFLTRDALFALFERDFIPFVTSYGFKVSKDRELALLRGRKGFFDVILVKAINYGMHFGVRCFNWWPEMALDGSMRFSSESTVILNGGALTSDGNFSDSGSGFIVGNTKSLNASVKKVMALMESHILPQLQKTQDWDSFVSTIDPRLLGTAQRVPGFRARFESSAVLSAD